MIRRLTRPLTDVERTDLEKPVIRMPENLWVSFVFGLLGVVPGGLLAAAGGAGLWNLGYFPTIGARVFLAAISVVVGGIGLFFLRFGLRTWIAAFPRKPVVVRPARDLRGASADLVEIIADHGWDIYTGDEDRGSVLLLRLPQGTFVLVDSEEVIELSAPGPHAESEAETEVTLCETVTITRFEARVLWVTTSGPPIPKTQISEDDFNALGWSGDELDVPNETELTFEQLTPALQGLVRTNRVGAGS